MKSEYSLTQGTKINSKWTADLNMTGNHKTPRRKYKCNTLWQKSKQCRFLDLSPKAKEIRKKNKENPVKLKSFCTAKEAINKTKRQCHE